MNTDQPQDQAVVDDEETGPEIEIKIDGRVLTDDEVDALLRCSSSARCSRGRQGGPAKSIVVPTISLGNGR